MAKLPKATKIAPDHELRRNLGIAEQNHYLIKFSGHEYYCYQEEKGPWLVNGWDSGGEREGREFSSLKDIKLYLVGDTEETETQTTETQTDANTKGTWDGPSLGAFLVLLVRNHPRELTHTLREALDKNGWLTEDGSPDFERAQREVLADLV